MATSEHSSIPTRVDVIMPGYNHANYLAQAVEGVMAQTGQVEPRILLGADVSPDNTQEVARQLKAKYPGRIELIVHATNQGMHGNIASLFALATAPFIAYCEGDDYWIDPKKLERAVAAFDLHPDVAITYHPVNVLQNKKLIADNTHAHVPELSDLDMLLRGNFMHTPSVVCRNVFGGSVPPHLHKLPMADLGLHIHAARTGKILRLPETMAVYRMHAGGFWSQRPSAERFTLWLKAMDIVAGAYPEPGWNIRVRKAVAHASVNYLITLAQPERATFVAELTESFSPFLSHSLLEAVEQLETSRHKAEQAYTPHFIARVHSWKSIVHATVLKITGKWRR